MSLVRNFASVGGATLLSRVLGFVRDILMAAILGAGPVADAFVAAFRLPNMFRRILAEGAFNTAFIPLFAKALETRGEEAAKDFAKNIISSLIALLLVLTVLAEIFMPQLIMILAPGFQENPDKFDLTVLFARICFPYLACMSLMAAYAGILNSLRKFLMAALAPVLLNVVLIGFLATLAFTRPEIAQSGFWLSIGVLIGGVAQVVMVVFALVRTGFLPPLSLPKLDKDLRRFWTLAVPALFTGGVTQINIVVGTNIASNEASAVSYLYYADRLYQLPLGIIGIAIGVVLLPELSRRLKSGDLDGAARVQDQSMLFAMMLTVPAAVALFVIAEPVIKTLFEYGAFSAFAAEQSAMALSVFALGLPSFVLAKILQPAYFARENTASPAMFAVVTVAVNVGFSLALFPMFKHVGIAAATTIAGWTNVALLTGGLMRKKQFELTAATRKGLVFLSLGAAVMGWGLFGGQWLLAPYFEADQFVAIRFVALLGLIAAGAIVYFGLVQLFGVFDLRRWRQLATQPTKG
ncbi:murein biosynthesis integral membrane protein MurJ [Maritalea mediterranea]|uniref:Probable lipid II flippase MurJ n=1 Tax=Maritalea mediterranea TaxID=2909667 RepID=A0ABS9E5C0_9HYPH|nr:murein biosynthesis integral membrane protein MurJ [Maritalea mediterranea]MCF4096990.1 murein biosynthesis integral membrane protein MurJ [Maritalea mediterranea]